MKNVSNIDKEKIMFIRKIARVNLVIAKKMLMGNNVCIFKAKAIEVKSVINELEALKIQLEVRPMFKY